MQRKKSSLLQPLDNLEKVACDLKSYLGKMDNKEAICEVIVTAEKKYAPPFYNICRMRMKELKALKKTLEEAQDSRKIVKAFVDFFQSGGWETTSANTILMSSLLKKLISYDWDSEKWLLNDLQITKRMSDLFLKNAQLEIEEKTIVPPCEYIKNKQAEIHQKLTVIEKTKDNLSQDDYIVLPNRKLRDSDVFSSRVSYLETFFQKFADQRKVTSLEKEKVSKPFSLK